MSPRVERVPNQEHGGQGRPKILRTKTPKPHPDCCTHLLPSSLPAMQWEGMKCDYNLSLWLQPGDPRAWGHCGQGGKIGAVAWPETPLPRTLSPAPWLLAVGWRGSRLT